MGKASISRLLEHRGGAETFLLRRGGRAQLRSSKGCNQGKLPAPHTKGGEEEMSAAISCH